MKKYSYLFMATLMLSQPVVGLASEVSTGLAPREAIEETLETVEEISESDASEEMASTEATETDESLPVSESEVIDQSEMTEAINATTESIFETEQVTAVEREDQDKATSEETTEKSDVDKEDREQDKEKDKKDAVKTDTWGSCKVTFNDDKSVATVGPGELSNDNSRNFKDVTKIIFEEGVSFPADSSSLFIRFYNLKEFDGLSNVNTDNISNMSCMFFDCRSLQSLDLSRFNTANVTNMKETFYECESLIGLDLSSFNTENVTSMESMFAWTESLSSLNLSSFNTSNVIYMAEMFGGAKSLESIDLSSFNTSKVTEMDFMFSNCNSLRELNLSSFNTSNVNNMSTMFFNSRRLENIDVSSFDTSSVTTMSRMFGGCVGLVKISFGPNSYFNSSVALPETTNKSGYTDKWLKEEDFFKPERESFITTELIDNQHIKEPKAYVREKNGKSITVQSFDTDGKLLGVEPKMSGPLWLGVTVEPPIFEGYQFKEASQDLNMVYSDEDQVINLIYGKVEEWKPIDPNAVGKPITVNYVDTSGNEIHSSTQMTGVKDTAITIEPLEIDGYKFDQADHDLAMVIDNVEQTITLTYLKVEDLTPIDPNAIGKPITVKYVDSSGKEIQSSTQLTGAKGTKVTIDVPEIKGYKFDKCDKGLSHKIANKKQTVTLTYLKVEDLTPLEPGNPVEPGEPSIPWTPIKPGIPEEPVTPINPEEYVVPKDNQKQEGPQVLKNETKAITKVMADDVLNASKKGYVMPQTGETKNIVIAVVGMIVLAIAGLFGYKKYKK
ncbi:BspA family leucine-rich repeat surface protein [Vagococcus coleopterorum]|uniref:BspA family leucine-rich repeat surface protein n=1 Tax=Vagococcus coleopterorum TaxID=2714946 RepID=A0A6G8AP79_9ENTE|nr:BspA family leucine-rich repeat surface protein [Vagococcus coleopterorum]QIL46806.1 BspA family leucine-rich repeat surface protein [Vagococcus coleopterorum]